MTTTKETKERKHRNATDILTMCHLYWAANQFGDYLTSSPESDIRGKMKQDIKQLMFRVSRDTHSFLNLSKIPAEQAELDEFVKSIDGQGMAEVLRIMCRMTQEQRDALEQIAEAMVNNQIVLTAEGFEIPDSNN
jgi:hypothetical protein